MALQHVVGKWGPESNTPFEGCHKPEVQPCPRGKAPVGALSRADNVFLRGKRPMRKRCLRRTSVFVTADKASVVSADKTSDVSAVSRQDICGLPRHPLFIAHTGAAAFPTASPLSARGNAPQGRRRSGGLGLAKPFSGTVYVKLLHPKGPSVLQYHEIHSPI